MRRAARRDANHNEIAGTFESLGFVVTDLSGVGSGCPDLLISSPNQHTLVEIKRADVAPSASKLNDRQQEYREKCPGPYAVVRTIEDCIALAKHIRRYNLRPFSGANT